MNDSSSLIDLSIIREMEKENPGVLKEIITLIITSIPPILDDINRSFEDRDMESLAGHAHKLKSTIDTFVITSLQGPIREIESLAKQGKSGQELQDQIAFLNRTFNLIFSDLRKEISQ